MMLFDPEGITGKRVNAPQSVKQCRCRIWNEPLDLDCETCPACCIAIDIVQSPKSRSILEPTSL